MRSLALASVSALLSVMATSWPASANTWAMPWPISPAPITAIRGLVIAMMPCTPRRHARRKRLQTDAGPYPEEHAFARASRRGAAGTVDQATLFRDGHPSKPAVADFD